MIASSVLPSTTRSPERTPSTTRLRIARTPARTTPIEIVAPDRHGAEMLLRDAARLFTAGLVPGPGWVIRVQPPAGVEGVLEVLALVVHWLDSIPLACTQVFHGDRCYLIRASVGTSLPAQAAKSGFEATPAA